MKVFSKSYLAEMFVLILGLTLGWSLWQQHRQKLAIDVFVHTLEQVNKERTQLNLELAETVKNEVSNEILNEGKKDNEGIPDTVDMILQKREHLLKSTTLNFSRTLAYQRWNAALFNNEAHLEEKWEQTFIDELPIIEHPAILENQVLKREWELLYLLYGGVGTTRCFSGVSIEPLAFPLSMYVPEGDTLKIWIGIDKSYQYKYPFYNTKIPPTFNSPSGIIEQKSGKDFAILKIPTAGRYQEGKSSAIFEYEVTIAIPKATGGYEELPFYGEC